MIKNYNRSIRALEILAVFKLLNRKPERILDFGYGDGQITNLLYKKGYNIIGLDKTISNFKNVTKIFPEVDFRLYDGINIPFEKNSFDTIILNDIMEHVPYNLMEELIKGLKDILKPNGIIYISVSNKFSMIEPHTQVPFLTWFPRVFWKYIERVFRKKLNYNKKFIYNIVNIYPYTFKMLRLLCLKNNLKFSDFTPVYVYHKFMKLDYIGGKFIREIIKFLKRIKIINLFFHLACRCSEIVCIMANI
ncbi:hypothetical protein LCGC14_0560220 [marine sediment metagenome]|uniref:Methyltransferase type 11 domain-containing protein n=1 Tax=marine sediment metagenome TaxID=412755 RepID=A0A0F9RM51_9ZZZZ